MKRNIRHILSLAVGVAALLGTSSCDSRRFHIDGTITHAQDSVLYLENMGLNGPQVVDSARLSADGSFAFSGAAPAAPEFYRLRIAGQLVNLSIDSTETVTVKADYPTMSVLYDVKGSDDCAKIKELAMMQMDLQARISLIARNPQLGASVVEDSVVRIVEQYKDQVKRNYIFAQPDKAYAYYALFQTVTLGNAQRLIFNPRSSEADVKVFAAVATSWDARHPGSERGQNLHNIAIEGMKTVRILRAREEQTIPLDKVNLSGALEIALRDNKGNLRRLSDLKGQVVLLDFHLFADGGSTKRIMQLRDLYNKYHARGLEIYQVSVDDNAHFWKTQTAALPWVSVHVDEGDASVLATYNVQSVPTFFLVGKDNTVYKRDAQIDDIDAAIQSLL